MQFALATEHLRRVPKGIPINYGSIYHREGSASIYNRIVQSTPQYQILHKVVYENQVWSDGGTKGIITAHYWRKDKCSSRC